MRWIAALALALAACGEPKPPGLTTVQREALVAIADALERGQDWDARLSPAYQVALQDVKRDLGEHQAEMFDLRLRVVGARAGAIRAKLELAEVLSRAGQAVEASAVIGEAQRLEREMEAKTAPLRAGDIDAFLR